MPLSSDSIRRTFIDFFLARGHTQIEPASLVADDTVLFTSAGMQPLIPHFSGLPHPRGRRLTDWQPCLRTSDIDEVGDAAHLTMFEMLGNWSLGSYAPEQSLSWTLELLCDGFGLDRNRMAVTVFAGDEHIPPDTTAHGHWRELGVPARRIFSYGREHNWWGPVGVQGPCGPDSELFYWTGDGPPVSEPALDERWLEVCNNVFITHERTGDGAYRPLTQPNVDMGMGLERVTRLLQGAGSLYDTDLLSPIMAVIDRLSADGPIASRRIVCDHLRATTFLVGDGVLPGNVERGYVVRRLIRRAVHHARLAGIDGPVTRTVAGAVIERFSDAYPHLATDRDAILGVLADEEQRFTSTLRRGRREVARLVAGGAPVDGAALFELLETHGLPPEVSLQELRRHGIELDDWRGRFERAQEDHRDRSRRSAAGRFAGGLAERSPRAVRLHTATHLLGGALRQVLGDHVHQRGSHITDERLRFDFSHDARLTDAQLDAVQRCVEDAIAQDVEVVGLQLERAEAEALGAEHEFGRRYPEIVSVYVIGELSREFCGGPHVARTGEVGRFRILKQESSGAGVRRIRATVE